jgi:putative membrane protein
MTLFRLAFAFIVLAFVAAHSHAQEAKKLSKDDVRTLSRMARADIAEIEAGKLAQHKASNPEVKKYGEHMVQEHTKMLEEGKKLAHSKGVKPPAATDKKHQAALKKLQGLDGDDFDRQYMKQMVQDHQDVMKLAQKAAKSNDPDIKAHAEKGTPHIKAHLDQAKQVLSKLEGPRPTKGAEKSTKSTK